MKIKIKSSDLHGQNYEQNFEVKNFLNSENKKKFIMKMNTENVKF